jgi:superfamily II DNA or RNA helicase
MSYQDFLNTKEFSFNFQGIEADKLHPWLFDYQADIVRWALRKGRSAIFADCGMGKTGMQVEWAKHVHNHTKKPILMLAPLAVSGQTILEAKENLGVDIKYVTTQSEVVNGLNITNYERLDNFEFSKFAGIVLDESSIIKSFSGKIRTQILTNIKNIEYRLACTATPSPNDMMELGNHAEFVGAMSREEMLSMFFVHDGGETSKWRLKGHAKNAFWKWACSWAVMITKPSDLGYSDEGFELPKLHYHEHICQVDKPSDGYLFAVQATGLQERIKQRSNTIELRGAKAAELINNDKDASWLVWCDRNGESNYIKKHTDCIEITGSDKPDKKEKMLLDFASGEIKSIVSKPKIAGFGMNWQRCHNMIFLGLSDSYESFYQAVRRCWRFGQKNEVHVHIVIASTEGNVLSNIQRKEKEALQMRDAMIANMVDLQSEEVRSTKANKTEYKPTIELTTPSFLGE